MILQKLKQEIQRAGKVSQKQLCQRYRISPHGVDAMLRILIKRGHVHKSMSARAAASCGGQGNEIWYSWHDIAQIPTTEIS
ncbi:FeoC-like transcriptional regulator [Motilimonas eburnea]|uniref:FeoC-like transcriptional regulator n=1 Tax=Motilimonas eburnea TaxID=1737488 RepID=UPI001E5820A6|nr:FeoC-like transcriptional regulator [Motilimonas eburnea]MCE2570231.1 FeoC-like transcriptional regulator [Motilimonas eburnea]